MSAGVYGRAGMFSLLVLGVLAAVGAAVMPLVPEDTEPVPRGAPTAEGRREPYHADSLRKAVIAQDVFRLDRRPAPLAFEPGRALLPPDRQASPPKPALRLVGLVEGTRPQALIEGLPGAERGRALAWGEALGGLRVAEIRRGQVRVVGMDTVWVLTLRRP
jgi:hypothetical protein